MKRIITLTLIIAMLCTLTACVPDKHTESYDEQQLAQGKATIEEYLAKHYTNYEVTDTYMYNAAALGQYIYAGYYSCPVIGGSFIGDGVKQQFSVNNETGQIYTTEKNRELSSWANESFTQYLKNTGFEKDVLLSELSLETHIVCLNVPLKDETVDVELSVMDMLPVEWDKSNFAQHFTTLSEDSFWYGLLVVYVSDSPQEFPMETLKEYIKENGMTHLSQINIINTTQDVFDSCAAGNYHPYGDAYVEHWFGYWNEESEDFDWSSYKTKFE